MGSVELQGHIIAGFLEGLLISDICHGPGGTMAQVPELPGELFQPVPAPGQKSHSGTAPCQLAGQACADA
jgi:hypothetical protein